MHDRLLECIEHFSYDLWISEGVFEAAILHIVVPFFEGLIVLGLLLPKLHLPLYVWDSHLNDVHRREVSDGHTVLIFGVAVDQEIEMPKVCY